MTDGAEGKRYSFEFSGDFVECVIAPVPMEIAELWLTRSPVDLFVHAFGTHDEDPDETEIGFIDRASELPGAQHLEGCELRHGSLEVMDADGNGVASFGLNEVDFQKEFVDDLVKIDPETHLLNGGPTLITRAYHSGLATCEPETPVESFGEATWYLIVTDMGGEPFISEFNFEGEAVPLGWSGPYGLQEVWLLVPDKDGNVRHVYHSEMPEPLP